jgi:hypothetical protein
MQLCRNRCRIDTRAKRLNLLPCLGSAGILGLARRLRSAASGEQEEEHWKNKRNTTCAIEHTGIKASVLDERSKNTL